MNNVETYISIAEEMTNLIKSDGSASERLVIALNNLIEAVKVLGRHAGIVKL